MTTPQISEALKHAFPHANMTTLMTAAPVQDVPVPLRVRGLTASDTLSVFEHLQGLSPASRRTRFGNSTTDAWLAQYATRFFDRPGLACGELLGHDLVALAEIRPSMSGDAERCEIGLSVADAFQGAGIGRRLLGDALRRAQTHGHATAEFWIDSSNTPMIGLLRNLCHHRSMRDGALLIEIDLTGLRDAMAA